MSVRPEPEVVRAMGRRQVVDCNAAVHDAPWTTGRTNDRRAGGLYLALEIAEEAYKAHGLPYEPGISHIGSYSPRRFTWVFDPDCDARECVKVRDDQTGKLAIW